MNVQISQDDVDKIAEALYAGRKIEAVKLYRAASGHDLKTALDFVNQVEARLRAETPEKFTAAPKNTWGCGVAALILILMITGVVLTFLILTPHNAPLAAPAVPGNIARPVVGKAPPAAIGNKANAAESGSHQCFRSGYPRRHGTGTRTTIRIGFGWPLAIASACKI